MSEGDESAGAPLVGEEWEGVGELARELRGRLCWVVVFIVLLGVGVGFAGDHFAGCCCCALEEGGTLLEGAGRRGGWGWCSGARVRARAR